MLSRTSRLTVPLIFFSILTTSAQGTILFESASAGGYGSDSGSTIGGYVGSGQILGAAFSLTQPVHVNSIGGLFFSDPRNGPDDIFGAIVRLSNSTALPAGDPFNTDEVVGHTLFRVGSSTAVDVLAPINIDLPPGDYAVVFGSGRFGATGIAGAPLAGPALSARYVYWGDGFPGGTRWAEGGHVNERFIVEGFVVPEASTFLLFCAGAITFLIASRGLKPTVRADAA